MFLGYYSLGSVPDYILHLPFMFLCLTKTHKPYPNIFGHVSLVRGHRTSDMTLPKFEYVFLSRQQHGWDHGL